MLASKPSVLQTPKSHTHIANERCPWCDQEISHEKFNEITSRIQSEEQNRSAEQEKRLEDKFAKDTAAQEALTNARIAEITKTAQTKIDTVTAEATKREAAIREQIKKDADDAWNKKFEAAEQAKKLAEEQLTTIQAEADVSKQKELISQREALEKAAQAERQKLEATSFTEKQKLEQTIATLQRQVQNKTAGELGEGAEIDLFEKLREAFPNDRIKRIDKGKAGADVWHDVVHNNEICGRIIYDSKNHTAWRNGFVTKLREDQLNAKADHAIVTARKLPAGENQLCIRDGVFVANPARVTFLVELLRGQVIHTWHLRLSGEQKDTKTAALYDYIISDKCNQLFDSFDSITESLLELDVTEKKQHEKNWEKRGTLIRNAQKAIKDQLRSEIDRIIEATDEL